MEKHPRDLIDEIHERRTEIFEGVGRDLSKLFDLIAERERKHPERVVDGIRYVATTAGAPGRHR